MRFPIASAIGYDAWPLRGCALRGVEIYKPAALAAGKIHHNISSRVAAT
jgi:hypothetical protein